AGNTRSFRGAPPPVVIRSWPSTFRWKVEIVGRGAPPPTTARSLPRGHGRIIGGHGDLLRRLPCQERRMGHHPVRRSPHSIKSEGEVRPHFALPPAPPCGG